MARLRAGGAATAARAAGCAWAWQIATASASAASAPETCAFGSSTAIMAWIWRFSAWPATRRASFSM